MDLNIKLSNISSLQVIVGNPLSVMTPNPLKKKKTLDTFDQVVSRWGRDRGGEI